MLLEPESDSRRSKLKHGESCWILILLFLCSVEADLLWGCRCSLDFSLMSLRSGIDSWSQLLGKQFCPQQGRGVLISCSFCRKYLQHGVIPSLWVRALGLSSMSRAVLHKHRHPPATAADFARVYVITPATRQEESPPSFSFWEFGDFVLKCVFWDLWFPCFCAVFWKQPLTLSSGLL